MEKKYNHQAAQQTAQNLWKNNNIYHHSKHPGALYAIDTPPPTVSGTLHIGHIFSYTQTDIIARHKRMQGNSVFYPFGFDDNGLPTERYVEKKCNVRAHTMKRSEFIALCIAESQKASQDFKQLWQNMGISADLENTYSTISDTSRAISQRSFLELLAQKSVYRRFEPAIYCTACRTSVAQAELDDAQHPSHFNTIAFTDFAGNDLLIATTRPELLPSCAALLYYPNDPRYANLKDTLATSPVFNTQVPILEDESVDPNKGTGIVMVCTFGDKMDIEWYKKYNLPYHQSIGLDGKMMQHTGILAGLTVAQARERIIQELKNANKLIEQKPLVHTVGVHERCKTPVEFLLLAQWFVRILEYKKELIAQADKINWFPTFMKSRYINWVENLNWDWGISRQRMYGIPFPVWHCTSCQEIIPADVNSLPIDPQERAFNGTCPNCQSNSIVADTDVMDTWNTSSLTPYLVFNLFNGIKNPLDATATPEFIPMAMRPQAHDIIRTWAFDTIVKAFLHHNKVPWNTIVISGHVLSDQKEKISKSKGNENYTPERLLQDFSADAIRYWTASGSLGQDVAFSVDQLKIGQRLVTKLWNAFLFAEPHLAAATITKTPPGNLGVINEWLLDTLSKTTKAYHEQLNNHEFGAALQAVETFFWHTYCDNYIELVKHMLFNPDQYDKELFAATQWTVYYVGLQLLQLYAPYLPFVTESIFQELYAAQEQALSIHMTKYNQYQVLYEFTMSASYGNQLVNLASAARKLKTEQQLSLKTPVAQLTINIADTDLIAVLQQNETMIKGVTQAEKIVYQKPGNRSNALHKISETTINLDIYL